jgi:hypothetical protein
MKSSTFEEIDDLFLSEIPAENIYELDYPDTLLKVESHYPTTLRFGDSSSNIFQCATLLKFGTHYLFLRKTSFSGTLSKPKVSRI